MAMNLEAALVAAVVALLVALFTHRATLRRDEINRLKAQKIDYLIAAFRAILEASHHPRLHETRLSLALSDVQLLGSDAQMLMATKLIADLSGPSKIATLDPLLESLRQDLRAELRIGEAKGKISWLRIESPVV